MNQEIKAYIERGLSRIAAELDSLPGQVRARAITQEGANARERELLAERSAMQRLIDEAGQ